MVGHVALECKADGAAELRRMSVKPGFRNLGIASSLLAHLTSHARAHGFRRLFLTTSSAQRPARALYAKRGWQEREPPFYYSGVYLHTYHLDLQ